MNREQILPILYDLALVVSGETRVAPLLTKMTQRLLYHTTYPCGLYLSSITEDENNPELFSAKIDIALCSRQLNYYKGQTIQLPKAFIKSPTALIDDKELLQAAFPDNHKYDIALCLPVAEQGMFVLMSPTHKNHNIPFDKIFEPVLNNFSKTLRLCQANEEQNQLMRNEIEEKRKTEQELSSFKTKLDLISDAVFIFEPEHLCFTYVNYGAIIHCGFSEIELLKMTPLDLKPEFSNQQFRAMLEPLINGEQSVLHFETYHRHKDGHHIPVDIMLQYINIEENSGHFIAIVRDITEQKNIRNDLLRAKEDAESANRAKSEFLSRMTHELRTPLNAVLGFAQLLEIDNEGPLGAERQQNAAEIIKAGNHLLSLINEVLSLSKIEAGQLSISLENINMNQLVAECLTLTSSLARKNHINLHNNVSPSTQLYVHADRTRLKQVLLNLISNAIKYNKPKGDININAYMAPKNTVHISIEDTGIGITPEKQEKLFQPFERLGAEQSTIEGTGIGLLITKHLIELMGGTIGVISQPGQGSTFWIELNAAASQNKTNKEAPPVSEQTIEHNNPPDITTILYVEDNPANLHLIQRIIEKRNNFKFISARNANIGIELAQGHLPDIILMDINLPGINGYEALKILRNIPETRHIPVIAISANAMTSDIDRGIDAGFFEYLTKPININQLNSAIDKAVSSKSLNDYSDG